jgi:hypothetical protein
VVWLSFPYNDCETKVLENNTGQITQDRANNKISAAQADRKFKKAKASNQTQGFHVIILTVELMVLILIVE